MSSSAAQSALEKLRAKKALREAQGNPAPEPTPPPENNVVPPDAQPNLEPTDIQDEDIDVIKAITPKVKDFMRKASVNTVGELWEQIVGGYDLTKIDGCGPVRRDKILEELKSRGLDHQEAQAGEPVPPVEGEPEPPVKEAEEAIDKHISQILRDSVEKVVARPPSVFTQLYVDCLPQGQPCVDVVELLREFTEEIEKEGVLDKNGTPTGVPIGYWEMAPFGEGRRRLAAKVVANSDKFKGKCLFLRSGTAEATSVVNVLTGWADVVVRGV